MFTDFSKKTKSNFDSLSNYELFQTEPMDIFGTYLSAFPEGSNPIYRDKTYHDCNCCKRFIRNVGNLVAIVDGKKKTIWECSDLPYPYDVVAKRMDDVVKQLPITGVFRTKEKTFGDKFTFDFKEGNPSTWDHFYGDIKTRHINNTPDKVRGEINTSAQVFSRGLSELKLVAVDTVIDLINQGSIYRGEEFMNSVKEFRRVLAGYQTSDDKDLYVWANIDSPAARFRNTAIGTLVQDLSSNVPVEDAVKMFESKVAPTNYKRSSSIITKKMIDDALKTLSGLGLENAVHRRFARMSDISVNDVLFVDNSNINKMKPVKEDLRAALISDIVSKPKKSNNTGISINDFVKSILPSAHTIEAMVKNRNLSNFVSLTAPEQENTGKLFKWKNDFAWSYDGEVADSIKQRVKKAGGNINAALRVSLAWTNYDDLDLHAVCPDGHIYYGNKSTILDVDMNAGGGHSRKPVENLSWVKPRDGKYNIYVNQYNKRETKDVGFTMEIENNGSISQFYYNPSVSGNVDCFTFEISKGIMTNFTVIDKKLIGGDISAEKWGVKTETFVPVSIVMNSPNHWYEAGDVGNKHWFFMLNGCQNPDPARGIYNEFLRGDLEPHRKVFEVIGSKTKCDPTSNQLSGLGFSAGRNDEVVVKVTNASGIKSYTVTF